MPSAMVNGLSLAYEVIGEGRPWAITPGGRFTKESPGVRELAEALAEHGNRVLIWDRPNCGASDVCFDGETESDMQADALAGLLTHLDMTPAVIIGGSGGSRVSLLTAARHREIAAGLALWWISGGNYGLMSIGMHYCGGSFEAAWHGGMDAVVALEEWRESIESNLSNRQRILDQDRDTFLATMDRWLMAYCACGDDLVPGLSDSDARTLDVPTLVFRSGASDIHHTRATSERVAEVLPRAQLVEPPWGDAEWHERQVARADGRAAGLFVRWPLLAPQLVEWAERTLRRVP